MYGKIFKQAYAILRAHRFLWALGLFLFWDMGANLYSSLVDQSGQDKINSFIKNSWTSHPISSVALFIIFLIVVLVFLSVSFRAKAGLILGSKAILDKEHTDFHKVFEASKAYYMKLFGIWFSTMFLMLLASVILATPVAYLLSMNYTSRASILALIALIIFLPLAIIANFINNIAPMFVVFFNIKIGEAVKSSLDMIRKFWVTLLVFSLWLGLLSLAATYLAVILISAGVEIFGKIFYNSGAFHITFASVSLIGIGFIAFLFFAGFIAAFQQICWVILFRDIIRPVKTEEEEAVPAPGVIS